MGSASAVCSVLGRFAPPERHSSDHAALSRVRRVFGRHLQYVTFSNGTFSCGIAAARVVDGWDPREAATARRMVLVSERPLRSFYRRRERVGRAMRRARPHFARKSNHFCVGLRKKNLKKIFEIH